MVTCSVSVSVTVRNTVLTVHVPLHRTVHLKIGTKIILVWPYLSDDFAEQNRSQCQLRIRYYRQQFFETPNHIHKESFHAPRQTEKLHFGAALGRSIESSRNVATSHFCRATTLSPDKTTVQSIVSVSSELVSPETVRKMLNEIDKPLKLYLIIPVTMELQKAEKQKYIREFARHIWITASLWVFLKKGLISKCEWDCNTVH